MMGNICAKKNRKVMTLKKNSSNSSSSSKYGGNSDGPPPIATNLSRYNFAKETYGTIGGPPINLLAGIFAKLMNGSYFYVLFFIFQCISVIVLLFWPFFIVVVVSNPNKAILGATTAYDAFAITCAGLFSVPSNYICNDPTALLILTLETAVGKLAVAGLTALLVLKISRVPNNLVVTSRLLVHKRNGKWTLSFRIGALHFQKIRNMSIRLFCYGTDGSQYRIQHLDAGSFSVAGGVNLAGPEPWNIRHVVDENSPIKHYHWDDLEKLKVELEEADVSISGFDATTGRNCGLHRKWEWVAADKSSQNGQIVYSESAKMADVFVKMTKDQIKLRRSNEGKTWGIDWKGFNAIRLGNDGDGCGSIEVV